MFSKHIFFIFASLAVLAAASPSVLLKIQGPDIVNGVGNLRVVTTLTNTGDDISRLLDQPGTVLSKLPTHNYRITHESGAQPSFTTVLAEYSSDAAVAKKIYTTLSPGQTITVQHDHKWILNSLTRGSSNLWGNEDCSWTAQVSSHSTKISGNFSTTSTSSHLRKRAVYVGCASDEKADIPLAITGASTYATGARDHLLQTLAGTHRYIVLS
ncbi:hypothetical protein CPC08DRAFT_727182 [Agrocybe pediades]|nr:hypothetical protein CPC08DRAFT_727182 [Agrocybe pediades]